MKSFLRPALIAFSSAALSVIPAQAAITMGSGDLAIAFYQTDASGRNIQPNTFVFDLGAASIYRESTQAGQASISSVNTSISSNNIDAQLRTAFGPNWANDSTVRWMVVGGVDQLSSTVAGDPARTSYISRGRSTLDAAGPGTSSPNLSTTNIARLGNSVSGFFSGTNGATQITGANVNGVQIGTSSVNHVGTFVPPGSDGTYFNIGIDPRQSFGIGTIDGSSTEGALDIYRYLYSTTDADLTAGLSAGNASVGAGQYIGTITLDSNGNLFFGNAVPEPSSMMLAGAAGLFALTRRSRNRKND